MSLLDCKQVLELITAYADGEVDSTQREQVVQHLDQCRTCALELANLNALKSAMRADALLFNAPGALVKRISTLIDKAADPVGKPAPSRPSLKWKWIPLAAAASFVVAAGIAAYVSLVPSKQQRLETQAVADHQRAVQSNHLVDFQSSDPVKLSAWFTAQANFAPMIPTRLLQGFTIAGGRLDMLDGRRVAVLVFHNNSKFAEAFQWPSQDPASTPDFRPVDGADVSAWNTGGMSIVVVSEVGPGVSPEIASMFTIDSCSPRN